MIQRDRTPVWFARLQSPVFNTAPRFKVMENMALIGEISYSLHLPSNNSIPSNKFEINYEIFLPQRTLHNSGEGLSLRRKFL